MPSSALTHFSERTVSSEALCDLGIPGSTGATPQTPQMVFATWDATHTAHVSKRLRFFFFNDTATTEIYTLSLHDALPICDAELQSFLQRAVGYTAYGDPR